MAGLRRGPVAGARALRPRRRAGTPRCTSSGWRCAHQGLRYNCAAVVRRREDPRPRAQGEAPHLQHLLRGPHLLPRLALPASTCTAACPSATCIFRFDFGIVAPEVCEDVWSADGPMRRRAYSGAELVVNISGSPFRVGVDGTRREMIATRAGDHQCTLAYANLVGGNDGLIFDGGGFVNQNGQPHARRAALARGLRARSVDLDRTLRLRTREHAPGGRTRPSWPRAAHEPVPDGRGARRASSDPAREADLPGPGARELLPPRAASGPSSRRATRYCDDVLDALALGVGDYFEKNRVFKTIGVALSGRPRLAAHAARRPPLGDRRVKPGRRRAACSAPSTCPPASPRAETEKAARDRVRGARRPAPRGHHRRGVRARAGGDAGHAPPGETRDPAHRAERPGPAARAAHVELEQHQRRPLPPDRQHEREGGRLHHRRRRPGGRAGGHRQPAQDGGDRACSTTSRRCDRWRAFAWCCRRPRARSSRPTRWARTS